MNKKALKVAFVAVLTMVSGVNVFNAQKSETLSDIALANVEALANSEDSECHYVNGVKNIQLDESFWNDTKNRYYDCCGVQIDGYSYDGECK